ALRRSAPDDARAKDEDRPVEERERRVLIRVLGGDLREKWDREEGRETQHEGGRRRALRAAPRRDAAIGHEPYGCANASRSFCSCWWERLVAMISNFARFVVSATRSMTASLVMRKSADVPSVTAPRTRLMKSSSIP